MTGSMVHRGPDDEGFYIKNGVGLGHRRLSIIDLSTGKQPLTNEDGSVVVVFNGEIYNYESLRDTLKAKGHLFKTRSDTEVIVHAYEEYGEEFLKKLRGMFAIALWDDRNRTLLLARDRVGIKPLYFSASSNWIVFASEIKAILQDSEFGDVEVNPEAVDSFLRFYFIPGRDTIFKNIRRLLPGRYIKVCNGHIQEHQYWDLEYGSKYHDVNFEDLKRNLDSLLRETVRGHMLSDVPVGFLLSGGVDSTALLSYAVNETKKEVSSFTVGFSGQDFADEREYAGIVARKFGTKHHDITISAADFLNFLPGYIWHMEEPVCEPPAIALYYVSKLASEYVKVLISGEGGDEAFAGYPNYANYQIVNKIRKFVGPLNRPIAKIINYLFKNNGNNRYKKYGYILGGDLNSYYYSRTSGPFTFFNEDYASIYNIDMINVHKINSIFDGFLGGLHAKSDGLNFLNRMLYVDLKTWLPDDLLIKADKMTMANSVELRVPFLDHKVIEFAANIPSKFKVKGTTTKFILKETFRGVVPDEILFRKKAGFPVPYGNWLRNELHENTQEILLDPKTIRRGYFKQGGFEKILKENKLNGFYSKEIFCFLVLEMWHRTFIDSPVRCNIL
jgi:asparagine synthase (glutamine-hydrolysing)